MASIKHNGFTTSQSQLALIFKALGHPARIAIVELLLQDQKMMCKELELSLPLSQATVSSHMKVLLENGILGYEKIHNHTYYIINPMVLDLVKKWLTEIVSTSFNKDHDYRSTFFKFLPAEA